MEQKFYAKIFIKTSGMPIKVEVEARNNTEAMKKIEALYGSSFKSWQARPQSHPLA